MPDSSKVTCGVLYKDGLEQYCRTRAEEDLFAAGFVSGQAEKVYLGACLAAMFRPSPERREAVQRIVADVCMRYGLTFQFLGDEVWIGRPGRLGNAIADIQRHPKDTPMHHRVRGIYCGVPPRELDDFFHERRGYLEQCDAVTPAT